GRRLPSCDWLMTCDYPLPDRACVELVLGLCALLGARRHPVCRKRPPDSRVLMPHLPRTHLTRGVMHTHLIHQHTADELGGHRIQRTPRPVSDLPKGFFFRERGENVHIKHHPTFPLDVPTADPSGQQHHRTLLELLLKTWPSRESGHHPHPVQTVGQVVTDRTHQIRSRGGHTSATFRRIVNAS